MTYYQTLSAAGFSATAIAFGPARMGFGLFAPDFKRAFDLSDSTIGMISSLGFAGFLVGLLTAQALLIRRGPEAPVILGLIAAFVGMGLVAMAVGPLYLAAGVLISATSAGLCWTPFNDAVNRKVGTLWKPDALSRISTGTSLGIAAAGLVSLAMVVFGFSWRICWAGFAIAAVVGMTANWRALEQVERGDPRLPADIWPRLASRAAWSLYAIAAVFGMTSANFIFFAASYASDSGGVPGLPSAVTPSLIYIVYGIAGLVGLLTSRVHGRIGLTWLVRGLMIAGAASLVVLAWAPDRWSGLLIAAGLQGAQVMMISAVPSYWSEELFPDVPSLGFTAAIVAMAVGSVLGPVVAGIMAAAIGLPATFIATAGLSTLAGLAMREALARETAVPTPAE